MELAKILSTLNGEIQIDEALNSFIFDNVAYQNAHFNGNLLSMFNAKLKVLSR